MNFQNIKLEAPTKVQSDNDAGLINTYLPSKVIVQYVSDCYSECIFRGFFYRVQDFNWGKLHQRETS